MDDDTQKLTDAINQLNERLKVVEAAKPTPEAPGSEAVRDRQERERDERKEKNESERYMKPGGPKGTPVNPRRYEEIKHRYSEMRSPAQAVQKARSNPDEYTSVYFYMWKNGKIHQVVIACKSQPSEIV